MNKYKVVLNYGDAVVTVEQEAKNMAAALTTALTMVTWNIDLLVKATVHNLEGA